MGKFKTKAIQIDLGTFRHTQAYSKPCVTLASLEPWYIPAQTYSEPEAYSEPPYIQNAVIFKIRGILRILPNIYDEAFCKNRQRL